MHSVTAPTPTVAIIVNARRFMVRRFIDNAFREFVVSWFARPSKCSKVLAFPLCDVESAAASTLSRTLFGLLQMWIFEKGVVETLTSIPIMTVTQNTWMVWQSA
jgi:hypothetical protein